MNKLFEVVKSKKNFLRKLVFIELKYNGSRRWSSNKWNKITRFLLVLFLRTRFYHGLQNPKVKIKLN